MSIIQTKMEAAELIIDGIIGEFGMTSRGLREKVDMMRPLIELEILINSKGGATDEGFAIFELIEDLKAEGVTVKTTNKGTAASMASIFLVSGSKGHRKMVSTGFLMIHNPQGGVQGEADDLDKAATLLRKIKKIALDVYSANSNLGSRAVSDLMNGGGTWLTAKEALKHGFIDEIVPVSGRKREKNLEGAMDVLMSTNLSHTEILDPMKIDSILKASLIAQFEMTSTSTDDQVVEMAVSKMGVLTTALVDKDKELIASKAELKILQDGVKADRVKNLETTLTAAVDTKKITVQMKTDYTKLGETEEGYKTVMSIVGGMNPVGNVSSLLTGGVAPVGREEWKLKDWSMKDSAGLATMRDERPEEYKELISKSYQTA